MSSCLTESSPLGDLIKPTRPRVKPSDYPRLPFIGMEHIEAHTMRLLGTVRAASMKSSAVHFQPGDVLYGRLRPYLNKVYRADFEGLCSAEFIVFPKTEGIESKYLQYFLNSYSFVSYASHLNTGDRPRVDFNQLASYPFPVVSTTQQKLIVAEIEKQFSRLDEAVAGLKRIKANLKRYKAAVLKAAVEGRLTEDWRKKHPNVEPASMLLKRILAERKKKREEKNPGKKYKEPVAPDTSNLPELPKGWVWTTLDALADVIDPNPSHRMPKYVLTGIPFISSENFTGDEGIDFTVGKQVAAKTLKEQRDRFVVEEGDFVLSRIGTIGKTRFLLIGRDYCLSHALVVIKVYSPMIDKRWLRQTIASESILSQAHGSVQSVGVPDLGMGKIRSFLIPLPSFAEQRRLVDEADHRLTLVREVGTQVDANLKRAERLRQGILKRAISGRLSGSEPI